MRNNQWQRALYYTTGDMDSVPLRMLEAVRLLNRKEHPDLEGLVDAYVRSALSPSDAGFGFVYYEKLWIRPRSLK